MNSFSVMNCGFLINHVSLGSIACVHLSCSRCFLLLFLGEGREGEAVVIIYFYSRGGGGGL